VLEIITVVNRLSEIISAVWSACRAVAKHFCSLPCPVAAEQLARALDCLYDQTCVKDAFVVTVAAASGQDDTTRPSLTAPIVSPVKLDSPLVPGVKSADKDEGKGGVLNGLLNGGREGFLVGFMGILFPAAASEGFGRQMSGSHDGPTSDNDSGGLILAAGWVGIGSS
jgi:hypothetical protein